MNRRSYLCLYVYDNSKEFKIGIAGFSIYGTKSEKLRFYLGSSSQNFFSPTKLKMLPRALAQLDFHIDVNHRGKHICDICFKFFSDPDSLNVHTTRCVQFMKSSKDITIVQNVVRISNIPNI